MLAAIDNGPDTTWYDLRLMAADVIRLAKRKSPHSLFYDPDKWREVRSGRGCTSQMPRACGCI